MATDKDAAKLVGRLFVDQRQLVEMGKTTVELALTGPHLLIAEIHAFPAYFLLLRTVSTCTVIIEMKINVVNWLLDKALYGSLGT